MQSGVEDLLDVVAWRDAFRREKEGKRQLDKAAENWDSVVEHLSGYDEEE